MALTGKTAVITGANGGIGFATAIHYLNEGVKVQIECEQFEIRSKLTMYSNYFEEFGSFGRS